MKLPKSDTVRVPTHQEGEEVNTHDLERSADYIEKHGWARGRLLDDHGRVCALGAYYQVMEVRTQATFAAARLADALDISVVADWNDQRGQTKAHVVASFRASAHRLRTTESVTVMNEWCGL